MRYCQQHREPVNVRVKTFDQSEHERRPQRYVSSRCRRPFPLHMPPLGSPIFFLLNPVFCLFPLTAGPGPRLHDFTLVSPTHKKILKTLGYIIYVRDEEYLNRLNMLSKKTPSVVSCIRNCVIITRKRWAKVGGATMRQDNQRIIHVNLIRKNSS